MAYGDDIFAALRTHDVSLLAYVPDAGHRGLIERAVADPAVRAVVLTTEEEGVALATGAWLGGVRAAVAMQSSGVGNCINLLALPRILQTPLLVVVTMRGEQGEENPWQVPMGRATPATLHEAGVVVQRCDDPSQAGATVAAAARLAFGASVPVAVLLGQRMIGTKAFVEG